MKQFSKKLKAFFSEVLLYVIEVLRFIGILLGCGFAMYIFLAAANK